MVFARQQRTIIVQRAEGIIFLLLIVMAPSRDDRREFR
jgi:hypothetical protein